MTGMVLEPAGEGIPFQRSAKALFGPLGPAAVEVLTGPETGRAGPQEGLYDRRAREAAKEVLRNAQ